MAILEQPSPRLVPVFTPLHKRTARDYIGRMNDDKVHCMEVANQFEADYWDGDRRYGYGGYSYDGRQHAIAEAILNAYDLPDDAKILDMGCGKGFLLYEFTQLLPNASVTGFDRSQHAIENAKPEIKGRLHLQNAQEPYPFEDDYFDLVLSLNTLHNLPIFELERALKEIERVGKQKFMVTESFRNERELFNLQCWALTCRAFFAPDEWLYLFEKFNYTGDYEFIYFERVLMLSISQTRAAILVEQNQPLVVDDIELPDSLDVGQVLVEVEFSGICGAQLGEIAGAKGEDRFLPHLLGHEGGAVVLEIGPGVQHVQPGDHVVMHWRQRAGINARPALYCWQDKPLNAGSMTTFNQHGIVSENRLTVIPQSLDLAQAAMFGCAVTTGLGVITNDAKLKLGESIVVIGAGGVGLNIIQGAALAGAYPIIAVDLNDEKLALASQFGASHVINSAAVADMPAAVALVLQAANKDSGSNTIDLADVVVDNTGRVAVIEQAYELTSPTGRTVLVGVPRHDEKVHLNTLPLHFAKTLTGSHGGSAQPDVDIPRYLKLVAAGKLKIDQLITHRYKLDQINDAIGDMRAGRVTGRCVVEMV